MQQLFAADLIWRFLRSMRVLDMFLGFAVRSLGIISSAITLPLSVGTLLPDLLLLITFTHNKLLELKAQNNKLENKLEEKEEERWCDAYEFRHRIKDPIEAADPNQPNLAHQIPFRLTTWRSSMSPITVLFDVDTGRIYIRYCEVLKSITLNVLARSDDNV
ncbi:hypothetical protein Tco_1275776 [Tanacetum coccineum]